MEAAKLNDVAGIDAECGGAARAHLPPSAAIRPGPTKPASPTTSKRTCSISPSTCRKESRLSCQIKVQPELDGLVVRVPASNSEIGAVGSSTASTRSKHMAVIDAASDANSEQALIETDARRHRRRPCGPLLGVRARPRGCEGLRHRQSRQARRPVRRALSRESRSTTSRRFRSLPVRS